EVLEKDRHIERLHESRLDWPGESAFQRSVPDVEAYSHRLRIEILDHGPHIPDRCADIVRTGMILPASLQTEFLVERCQVLQACADLTQGFRDGSVLRVFLETEAILLNAQPGRRAQDFLRERTDLGD